jgi:hypothetical protein
MTERVLGWVGRASAILLAIGLAMLVARPDWPIGSTLVHAGVAALMMPPMTRVLAALTRSIRIGDSAAAALAAAILMVVGLSVLVALR